LVPLVLVLVLVLVLLLPNEGYDCVRGGDVCFEDEI
jgi:hypothetical protein